MNAMEAELTQQQKYEMCVAALRHIEEMVCFSEITGEKRNAECNCFSCSARSVLGAIGAEVYLSLPNELRSDGAGTTEAMSVRDSVHASHGVSGLKFRKKPVVIEAMQVPTGDDPLAWGYLAGFMNTGKADWNVTIKPRGLAIRTLEGQMQADVGDWIIKGVKGEFYPCKPDIFEATYERAEVGG